jgi:hypothetical protein
MILTEACNDHYPMKSFAAEVAATAFCIVSFLVVIFYRRTWF